MRTSTTLFLAVLLSIALALFAIPVFAQNISGDPPESWCKTQQPKVESRLCQDVQNNTAKKYRIVLEVRCVEVKGPAPYDGCLPYQSDLDDIETEHMAVIEALSEKGSLSEDMIQVLILKEHVFHVASEDYVKYVRYPLVPVVVGGNTYVEPDTNLVYGTVLLFVVVVLLISFTAGIVPVLLHKRRR